MALRLYRVCRAKYARLDGYGARLVGGRWNSAGRPVVYMAESISLAVLENLVHMSRQDFPTGYVVVSATAPDHTVPCTEAQLRAVAPKSAVTTQELGDFWLDNRISAVLKVASSVVPKEHNFLLNPEHPDFGGIEAAEPLPFRFDPRLFH